MKKTLQILISLSLLAAGALSFQACQRERAESQIDLAVNDKTLNLPAEEGSTHVLVFAKSAWNVVVTEPCDWLYLQKASGSSDGEFILGWDTNAGVRRRASLTLSADKVDSPVMITLNQSGENSSPESVFTSEAPSFIAWSSEGSIPFQTNLPLDYIEASADVDWIESIALEDGLLSFKVSDNDTGEQREGSISLTYTDIDEKVTKAAAKIVQTTEAGYIRFADNQMNINSFEADIVADAEVQLGIYESEVTSSVSYEGSESGWISAVSCTDGKISFHVTANTDKVNTRTASISFALPSKGLSETLTVVQSEFQQEYTAAELRTMLTAAGTIEFTSDFFQAVAITDAGEANAESYAVKGYGNLDKEQSARTGYVQTEDGSMGFRLQTATADDNVLKRGYKYKISLKGATLTREDNPVRYTISGLTANSFGEDGEATVPTKNRTISQLTDDDIYTWTTITDVELSVDYGCWSNVANAWKGTKQNTTLRSIRDKAGEKMNMLINTDVPWVFRGSAPETATDVPHGSGNISGVVVHADRTLIPFYEDFTFGTYQIRPIAESDIAISEEAGSGFSRNLAVWYYPHGKTVGADKGGFGDKIDSDDANKIWSRTGDAWFAKDASVSAFNNSPSYMDVWNPSPYEEGDARSMRCTSNKNTPWWSTSKNEGIGFQLHFSTASVTGSGRNPVLVFAAAGGQQNTANTSQTPVWWKLTYSLDGGAETEIETVMIRPIPSSTGYTLNTLALELTEICVDLPDEILGHDSVDVYLRAADAAAIDWSTGKYTATAGQVAQYMRFGSIAIKYNK